MSDDSLISTDVLSKKLTGKTCPLISIITVTFNSEKTIERTLKSVFRQSYKNIEHIVIDGASTDLTLSIIEKYRDSLAYFHSEVDSGVYDAMNKGLAIARGDIVAFLNSDDFYEEEGIIQRVVSEMENNQLDVLFGDVVFFRFGRPERTIRKFNSRKFRADRLSWGWVPAHPGLFVRRPLFAKVGSFSPEYRIAGDFEFMVRLFKVPNLAYKHLDAVIVRMQLGGLSTQGYRSAWIGQMELMKACERNDVSTNHFKLLSRYILKILEYRLLL